ncbi:hypothetical protein ABFX02_10G025300 [Erythranthe guttata]
MGHVLRQERSFNQQHPSDAARKEKIPLPWTDRRSSFQDKHKVGPSYGQPYLDPKYELRQSAGTEKVAHSKFSENELVKHMSNLPGFLQQVEKDNSIQEKALNFGVLDWKRLEKWKYTERMPGKNPKKTSPTSNSVYTANGPPKIGPNLRKLPPSHGRNPSLFYSGQQPIPQNSRFSSPQKRQPPPLSSYLNSSKEEKYVEQIETVPSYKGSCSEETVYNTKRKDRKRELVSEKEASSSEHGKSKVSIPSHNKIKARGEKSEMRFDEGKVTYENIPDPQNIVLLVPKDFPKASSSESSQFTESRTSVDEQLVEVTVNRLSDFFSPQEFYSGELTTDIPHSCPLPAGTLEPKNLVNSQANDLDICPIAKNATSITSESKCSVMHEETARPSSLAESSDSRRPDTAGQPTVKGRAPSPTRRFSFSLGKMSRSFSFKDSSEVPQMSSTYTAVKSGPVKPEVDNHNRGRSSPLRRLLDPLLKHKGPQSAEIVKPLNRSLHSTTNGTTKGSTLQALLQLTLKNGLPFFKFVVDNSNDMLAAAVKRLPVPGKSDPCMVYVFYSVHEIRKKGMKWMNQGSKGKDCNLGYKVVGQMKISNSYYPKGNARDSSVWNARECVMYGADSSGGLVDKKTPEFVPNKEIVAIVVKNSSRNSNQFCEEREFSECASPVIFGTEENKSSNGTVVILPGGVHGVPIKGAPSSLISRWSSGGSCDCGGWDVGCKLRILSDDIKSSKNLPDTDHVNLFAQGGDEKSKPVFSLKPFSNELYSIELDASVSLLEAFATCVAYVTCWKFPEILDTLSEGEHFQENIVETDIRRTTKIIPTKYVTCPPLSPAGRI